MDRQHFIVVTAVTLFAAFLIGWFAHWLVTRLTRAAPGDLDAIDALARDLHAAEEARDQAVAALEAREAELSQRLVTAEGDLGAARDALADSQAEIEELRGYIEKRLTRSKGTPT